MNDKRTPDADNTTKGSDNKPWWKRWWGVTAIVLAALIVLVNVSGDPQETEQAADEQGEAPAETEPDPEAEGTQTEPPEEVTPEPEPEPEPEPAVQPAFGNGTHTVGQDVQAGTYRSDGATASCYWSRLSGFGGELDDVIANGNAAPEIVTISDSDAGFETMECGDWYQVEDTHVDAPATEFQDGTFAVGGHISPGTYRADGAAEDFCYWARLSNFDHAGVDGIIANGNNPTTIEIAEGDVGFTSWGCGTWTRAG